MLVISTANLMYIHTMYTFVAFATHNVKREVDIAIFAFG